MENLYTVKELSQKCNVSEKIIYSNLKNDDKLKENIIYKGKKTYLNEDGLKILNEILHKEIEKNDQINMELQVEEEVFEEIKKEKIEQIKNDNVQQVQQNSDNLDGTDNIKNVILNKSSEEAIILLMEQVKEKDNLIKRLVSLIESNQVILEKDREKLLDDAKYYKTLEILEDRAAKFDENIPYLRNKLDYKKNSKKWWKKGE